ncbi:MAG: succinate dehydrogenase assembly factor 2 [Thermaurantiacus sp.]
MDEPISEAARRRAIWRANHRGTKEADMLVGGFAARFLDGMGAEEFAWFEALLEEQDVDILSWAFGTALPPPELDGPMMERLRRLDYVTLAPR